MWILYWNCKGSSNSEFREILYDFVRFHKVDLVFITELKICSGKAIKAVNKTGFYYSDKVDAVGFSGGLWALWNDASWEIKAVE